MTDNLELPSEHVAKCCWCKAPIIFKGDEAWCSGSQECRDRQIAAGLWEEQDGIIKWLFLPTPKQTDAMVSRKKNLFVWGNRGGGKSVCMRWLCHALALSVPGFKYSILRTSFVELNKNHLIFLDAEMMKFGGTYHRTDHICYYPNGSIGFYSQCETDADVNKILGAEVCLVVFDEAPTFEWYHMRLIAASVRATRNSPIRPMVRYLGNPVGESIDELWSYCIDKEPLIEEEGDSDGDSEYDPVDWDSVEMRLEDNPHLDYKEYRKQFVGLPKHIRKAWLDGVRAEERTLFEFYPRKYNEYTGEVETYHVVEEIPIMGDGIPVIYFDTVKKEWEHPNWVKIYRGYDHGFFPDPAVMLWFAVCGRLIICFKEQHWYRTVAKDIAKEALLESKGMDVVTTYCDPSIDIMGGHDIYTTKQVMENEGMAMDSAVNDRALFADVVHRMLGEENGPHKPRIVFYSRGCPMLIKYIPRMKWDEHDPRKMAEHKYDHWVVVLAYFAMTQIPVTKPGDNRKPRKWQIKKTSRFGSPTVRR